MQRVKLILLMAAVILMSSACTGYTEFNTYDAENMFQGTATEVNEIKDSGPVKGGALNLFSTKPDTLNPLLTKNIYVKEFLSLVFESLFKLDKNQKAVPVLADNWEISDDGLIWTFHIRNDVRWHDGMPLTADDIKFTLEMIQNSSIDSVYKKNVRNIAVFTVVNRNTFRVFLKEPDSFTSERMTFPILPVHYFAVEDFKAPGSGKNMSPLGTGPYKYVSGSGTNQIKLVANEKWWNSEDGENPELSLPYISEVNIKIFDSEKDALSAFQVGEIDVVPVQAGDFSKYSRRSDINIIKYIDNNYEFIAMNLENPVLSNKAVRQSIAGAIDKTSLIDENIPGEAVAADIPIIPNTWLNNTNTLLYAPVREKARELLVRDGWKEENGVMYKNIDGRRRYLRFELLVNDFNKTRSNVAKAISEQLREIGMDITVKSLNWDEELKKVKSGDYDMALMGYRIASIPDISFAYASEQAIAGFNVSGFKNEQVDAYLKQIKNEKDQDKKKAIFLNMKNIIADEVPYIGLYFYNSAVLYNKRIKGEIMPYIWDRYNNIVKWYIPEKK